MYSEDVSYSEISDPRHNDVLNKTVYDALLPLEQVLPFGYPTEQFFRQVKQDIHDKLEEHRAGVRNGTIPDDTEAQGIEKDTGLLPSESGMFLDIPVNAWGLPSEGVTIVARVTDTLYNNYRK